MFSQPWILSFSRMRDCKLWPPLCGWGLWVSMVTILDSTPLHYSQQPYSHLGDRGYTVPPGPALIYMHFDYALWKRARLGVKKCEPLWSVSTVKGSKKQGTDIHHRLHWVSKSIPSPLLACSPHSGRKRCVLIYPRGLKLKTAKYNYLSFYPGKAAMDLYQCV